MRMKSGTFRLVVFAFVLCTTFTYAQFLNICEYDRINKTCEVDVQEQALDFEVIGIDVQLGVQEDWPYLVSLQIPAANRLEFCFEHTCGGVLISPTLIVTAAHCISARSLLPRTVNEGEPQDDLFAARSPRCRHLANERIKVNYIWINPSWNNLIGDIAVLQLSCPFFQFNGPFLNYQNSFNYNLNQPLQDLRVAGWGNSDEADTMGLSRYSVDPLIEAPVHYRSTQICKFFLKTHGDQSSADAFDDQYMFCTYSQGADTCSGDSGGPLIVRGDNPSEDILVGVISWGPAKCISSRFGQAPQVYTRVSEFVPWIDELVSQVQS